MPASTPVLWPEINIAFEGVDLILHAGDLEMVGVLDMLEEILGKNVKYGGSLLRKY